VNKSVDYLGFQTFSDDPTHQFSRTAFLSATKLASDDAITLIAISSSSDMVFVSGITNPQGTLISDPNDDPSTMLNRSYENQGAQAVLIPQTPDIEQDTPAGTYTFVVFGFSIDPQTGAFSSSSAPGVEVYVVHTPKTPQTQIDVNLFFSGSAGITAANASSTWRTQNAVATLKSLYSAAGITVVNTRLYTLPSAYQHIAYNDAVRRVGYKTMDELFVQANGKPAGLNFYFIGDLDADGTGQNYGILGVAGGIPGPGAFNDTSRSGVLVVLDTTATSPNDDLGATMAHEGGHFLGLFHAEESDGSFDNISDTPDSFAAENNVMYWAATPTATTWSPLQCKTLRRHPLVY
jgi:hypothetical protein